MKRISILIAGLGLVATAPAIAAAPKAAQPLGNPGEWVTTEDYPTSALRDRMQGAVSFRLSINTTGRVENCLVTVSSGFDILDDAACNLITQRAIFSPATDSRNRPVPGTYSNRVRWVVPDPDPEDTLSAYPKSTLDATMLVDANGKVLDCQVTTADGVFKEIMAGKPGPCEDPLPIGPMRDADGKPQKRRVHILFNVSVDPVP